MAAKFSFLLAIPAMVGAELTSLPFLATMSPEEGGALLAGMGVAAVPGWLAIDFLLRLVQRGKLGYFAIYCVVVGTLVVSLGLGGW